MALVRRESTTGKDATKEKVEKELSETTVSYQDSQATKSKMGPISSTVEGSK